jgi:hypothetical protein
MRLGGRLLIRALPAPPASGVGQVVTESRAKHGCRDCSTECRSGAADSSDQSEQLGLAIGVLPLEFDAQAVAVGRELVIDFPCRSNLDVATRETDAHLLVPLEIVKVECALEFPDGCLRNSAAPVDPISKHPLIGGWARHAVRSTRVRFRDRLGRPQAPAATCRRDDRVQPNARHGAPAFPICIDLPEFAHTSGRVW